MRFDVDRLAKLAGVRNNSGLISEAKHAEKKEEDAFPDVVMEDDFPEPVAAEGEHKGEKEEGHTPDHAAAKMKKEADKDDEKNDPLKEKDDPMLEIDETMLRAEIEKMKKEKLQESQLRGVIRNEIKNIFEDLGIESGSAWMYGDEQPTQSKKGYVHQGAMLKGIGFK